MSHMHRLLCSALLLFLLCCAYGCTAAPAVVQPLPQKGQSALDAHTVSVVDPEGQGNWESIRIRVFSEGVNRWIKECPELLRTYYYYSKIPFCYGEATITPEKAKVIHDVVVEGAQLHMDRLRVQRVKAVAMFLDVRSLHNLKQICPGITVPTEHLSNGIPNADFALYVSPAVSREHPLICTKDYQNRPTSALIKVNPKEFKHTRYYVRLTAHDIGHGLGFYLPEFKEHDLVKEARLVNQRVISYLHSDILKEKGREHFGCPKLDGVELEGRDEGYVSENFQFHPHWKRRYAKDELMSTDLDRPSGMYYTNLTLAAFHSLPFYQADFSKAETMSWGRKKGCDFIDWKCIENDVSNFPEMFCIDEKKYLRCTTDRTALGKCSLQSLEYNRIFYEFNYFSRSQRGSPYSDWMDHCPAVEPTLKTSCELGDEDEMPGSLVSNTSQCLDVTSLVLRKGGESDAEGICAKVRCKDGFLEVQYKGNSEWHICRDGDVIDNLTGDVFTDGVIFCPNYADFCKK